MKNICILLILLYGSISSSQVLVEKSFSPEGIKYFSVSNFAGDIEIGPSSNNKINVKAILIGDNMNKQASIEYIKLNNFLVYYLKTPCSKDQEDIQFDFSDSNSFYVNKNNCQWEGMEDIMTAIKYEITIPAGISVYATNITNGDITISNIDAPIKAQNVDGSVRLTNVDQVLSAKTVNGDVSITYNTVPKSKGSFSTISGTIEAYSQKDADVNASFKSFDGDFYTDMKEIEILPSGVFEQSKKDGFKYEIQGKTNVKIGQGGPILAFETFSGDAYFKIK